MKTWQCVLLSVAVHGVIFGMPITLKTPDLHTEEIQLLVLESPPMDIPVEKILEPVGTPRSAEPPERSALPVKLPMREPPSPRKKPIPAASVPKAQPDSETLSNKPSEVVAETPQAASPQISDGVSELTPSENASTRSEGATAGGHGSHGSAAGGNASGHGHGVESTVGAMGGPQFIQRSVPRYPRLAQRLGVEGSVLLRLAIDASGKLSRIEVVNGAGNGFDEEAVQAVKRSTFAPAVQNGRPISCLALLKIRFHLSSE
ncbi:MAG: energy transducer TonB [Pseudomonadota bacterium]